VSGLRETGPEFVLPVGEPVRITLVAADVVHAFYVPAFLFKRDAVPGRETVFEITIEQPGSYGGQCAEFCGTFHSRMPFTIRAVSRTEFEAWLASQPGLTAPSPSPSG
jgi:cytochrome c oxidase subunit II